MTGPADYFAEGDWNVLCAQCGRKLKASRAVKNWQGNWRCPEHNEPRHPQDFVRGLRVEGQAAPFVQHPADIENYFCTVQTRRGVAGIGEAGCAVPLGTNDRSRSLTGLEATGQVAQTISTAAIQTAAASILGIQGTGQTSSNLSITGVANPVVNPGTVKGTGAAGALTTTQTGDQGITGVSATGAASPVTAFGETTIFANLMGVAGNGRVPRPETDLNPGGPYVFQGYTFTPGANAIPASSGTKFGFDSRSPVFGSITGSKFYAGEEIKAVYTDYTVPADVRTIIVMTGTLPKTIFGTVIFYSPHSGGNSLPSSLTGSSLVFTQTGTETIWSFFTIPGFEDYRLSDVGATCYMRFTKPQRGSLTGTPAPPPA